MKRSESTQHPAREKEGILLPYGGSVDVVLSKKFLEMLLARNRKQREELMRALAELDETDVIIRKRLREIGVGSEEVEMDITQRKKKVFRPDIRDGLMADALYEVYEKVMGNNEEAKKKNYGLNPIDVIAYLFVMVDINHYGRDDFHCNGKRPFFEFFIDKVRPELRDVHGITRKTMSNRINGALSCLYLSPEERNGLPEGLRRQNKRIENDFNVVCGIFHKTRLGKILFDHA